MRPARIFATATPFACALTADIFTKIWANNALLQGRSVPFIPSFLQLSLTRNTGIAFGIGQGHAVVTTAIGCTIFLAILAWIIWRERGAQKLSGLELSGAGFILGGALGNIFDRVCHGEVTDFLEFVFVSFPVFNVADVMIDVGAGLVIISSFMIPACRKVEPHSAGNS